MPFSRTFYIRIAFAVKVFAVMVPVIILHYGAAHSQDLKQQQAPQSPPLTQNISKTPDIVISIEPGLGYSNNLQLVTYLDEMAENAKLLWNAANGIENKSVREEPIFYGGIEAGARKLSETLGYGLACGYYKVTDGRREVRSSLGIYKNRIELSFISLRASVFYKFPMDTCSFLLINGGIGFYRGTMESDQGIYYFNTDDVVVKSKDASWTIGWHSGLEYNNRVYDSFILSIGILSRFVEVFNLEIEGKPIIAGLTGIYLYAGAGYLL